MTETILCKQEGNQLAFYCKYCKKKHYHGLGEGYRHPHCFDKGYTQDYYLKESNE